METAALISLIGLLIGIVAVGVPVLVRWLGALRKELKEQLQNAKTSHDKELTQLHASIQNTHSQCDKIKDREIINETKLDMLLDEKGFDIRKVNKAIKEHMDELKENNTPSIGCINVKELYREAD